MTIDLFKKIISNAVLALQVLILWVLFFEDAIATPPIIQFLGRLHPMVLHLPIGLIVITALVVLLEKNFQLSSPNLPAFLLHFTALVTSLSVLMGLFLSLEGGYDPETLFWHKWMGVGLSFIFWFFLLPVKSRMAKPALAFSVVVVIFTGHYGAMLTHGEDFVSAPLFHEGKKQLDITDSTSFFSAAIQPVLEAKCVGCHNEKKTKGKLLLTSVEGMWKGGKNGKLWVAGDADHSLLVERIGLPLAAKEHMPPKDKPQLTANEQALIELWIDRGADMTVKFSSLVPPDTLSQLAAAVMENYFQPQGPIYSFEFADAATIQKLSTPSRTVFQLARNEPALCADFYLRDSFDKNYLTELLEVKEQLVSLNLSNMPVSDDDLEILSGFPNLERVILNNTPVTGKSFASLRGNDKLKIISLSGSRIEAANLEILGSFRNLRSVFIWNTGISREEVKKLSETFPLVAWNTGVHPDVNERLKLNPPQLKNDGQMISEGERIILRHNLPGISIRYTIDGTDPDSVTSKEYKEPIRAQSYTVVKTRAFREGWISSDVAEYLIFRRGAKPAKAVLSSGAEPKYEGEGIQTLIDGLNGMPGFYRDPSWVGFRNTPLDATFEFDGERVINSITISYARNIWAMCMPPQDIEVWVGDRKDQLTLIKKGIPDQPDTWLSNRTEGFSLSLPAQAFKVVRIVAKPLAKLPDFRDAKKEKGWLMVDEILFN